MEKIFNLLDLYPHQILFSHNKKNFFFSIYGILLSFLTYLLIIYLAYYFSYDLINHKNPKLKIIQSLTDENSKITLDKIIKQISFTATISFDCDKKITNFEELFDNSNSIDLSISNIFNNESTTIKSLKHNKLNITGISESELNNGNFFYSIDYNIFITNKIYYEDKSINLSSFETLNEIEIIIQNTKLEISYNFLKPNKINNFTMNKKRLEYSLKDNIISSDNFYYSHSIDSNFTDFYNSNSKLESLNMIYKIIQFQSDENYIFNNHLRNDFIPQIDFYYRNYQRINRKDKNYQHNFLYIEFRDSIEIHNRIYKKILDVISEIGGMLNPIFIFGRLIAMSFNEKKYKINILNKLFTDEDIHREIKKSQKYNNLVEKRNNFGKKSDNFFDDLFRKKPISSFEEKKLNNETIFEMKNLPNLANKIDKIQNSLTEKLDHDFEKKENLSEKFLSDKESNFNCNNVNIIDYSNKFFEDINNNKISQDINDEMIKEKIHLYSKVEKTKKRKLLQYSFIDLTFSIICWRKIYSRKLYEMEDIFNKISMKLEFYFEITNLMRLYENFEKMKFVLFNENQIECFNFMIYDVNLNKNLNEEEILFDLSKYFKKSNKQNIEKYLDESIKILMKDEIKNLILIE